MFVRGNLLNGNYRAREIKAKNMDLHLNIDLDDAITDSLGEEDREDSIDIEALDQYILATVNN